LICIIPARFALVIFQTLGAAKLPPVVVEINGFGRETSVAKQAAYHVGSPVLAAISSACFTRRCKQPRQIQHLCFQPGSSNAATKAG
jgi:hypothetical protein